MAINDNSAYGLTGAQVKEIASKIDSKQGTLTAGTNVQISADNEISATDTTYSAFTGTDGQTAGTAGLVPAPATTDAGKVLGANGTWVTDSPTVVQTTGNSTTDVMSQDATTSMVYADPSTKRRVRIGGGTSSQDGAISIGVSTAGAVNSIAIGHSSKAYIGSVALGDGAINPLGTFGGTVIGNSATAGSNYGTALGNSSNARNDYSVALGANSYAGTGYSVALGAGSKTTVSGEVNIGLSGATYAGHGYNSSEYRLLTGLYDPQSAHDAATKGYIDGKVLSGAGAPTTSTVGAIGQIYEDTTNGKLYQCIGVDTTPNPAVYTWGEMATVEQLSWRRRKPVVVWEVDGTVVTTGLVGVNEDISANPNWQLTNLDLTPYKRIKIFTKATQKAGTTASASTTPAMVLEMSLDPRAAIAEYGGNYVGSMIAQKPNDANRLCTLTCAVSADKTKFEVLRMTNLYGTAATSNSDVNGYVFKIEGYYD